MSLAHDLAGRTLPIPADMRRAARAAPIVDVVARDVQWDRRRTRRDAGDYWARCPFHSEKTASFHVNARKGLFKCFGCGEGGTVIDYVMAAENLDERAAVELLAQGRGLRPLTKREQRAQSQAYAKARAAEDARKRARVAALADEGSPPEPGGPVRSYASTRGLVPATVALAVAAGALREHRDAQGRVSMLALAHDPKGRLRAVQLTKLKADGSGKRGTECDRLTFGPYKGSACRLFKPTGDTLAVAEGVETALAFYTLRKVPTWATFGSANLAAFEPPAGVRRLVIAADGDAPGMEAAQTLFDRLRRRVRCIIAPAPDGLDWLDVLNRGGGSCR
jgi:hypothetical protein